jgi:hypothetical protein
MLVSLILLSNVHFLWAGGPPLQLNPLSGPDSPDETLISSAMLNFQSNSSIRLPQNIAPIHYNLEIRPILNLPLDDPQQFKAPGLVRIHLRCLLNSDNITLHSDEISIDEGNVTVSGLYSEG